MTEKKKVITVRVRMRREVYDKAVKMRRAAGMPSVAALLLLNSNLLDQNGEAEEIFKKALRAAEKLPIGKRFRLRDLSLPRRVWPKHSAGARIKAGKLFNARVALSSDGIIQDGKASGGHQVYRIKSKVKRKA